MKATLYVIAGALLTLSCAMAAGQLLLSALRFRLSRMEERLFALVAGAGCWSALVYVAAWLHLARKGVFVGLAAVLIGSAFLARRGHKSAEALPEPGAGMRWLFRALFTFFFVLYLVYAAAPGTGLAGNHLGRVKQMWESRGFPAAVAGIEEPRPSAVEFLYLPAYSIGQNATAALVHLAFLAALALGMVSYARRRGCPNAGVFAGLLMFLSPLAAVDATAARTEAALACTLFFCFYALELWSDSRQWRTLLVAGALLLFAISIGTSPATGSRLQEIAARTEYLLGKTTVLTTTGATGQGFFGPVFLLAPLALVALRGRTGWRVLLAAAVSAVWLFWSPRPETALPAAAFISLAMGLAIKDSPGMIPTLVVAHAVLSLPWVTPIYSWPDVWRLRDWPWMAERHCVNEDACLTARMFPAYTWARAIDQAVAKRELVFSLVEPARAYCSARVIVAAESVGGRALHEMLQTPLRTDLQATETLRLTFPARPVQALRLAIGAPVRIHEVRLFHGEKEVGRDPRWRLRGSPDPADAGYALDNSYVTAWTVAEPAATIASLEIELGSTQTMDGVALEWPAGQKGEPLELWLSLNGRWEQLTPRISRMTAAPHRGLRRAAIFGLKQRGFKALLVPSSDPCAKDLMENSLMWGVTPIRETHEAVIYRLD